MLKEIKNAFSRRSTTDSSAKMQNTGIESNTATLPVFESDLSKFLADVEVNLHNNRPPFCIVVSIGGVEYSALYSKRSMGYIAKKREKPSVR